MFKKLILISVLGALALSPSLSLGKVCDPVFKYSGGWLGADDAYSLGLLNGKALWFFGNTFTGPSKRSYSKMIDNSIAVSECGKKGAVVNYFWGFAPNGAIQAFFQSSDKSVHYRPLDSFSYEGKIYVFLAVLNSKPGGIPSENFGIKLARIDNSTLVPQAWEISYSDIISSTRFIPGISAVVSGEHVYLFGAIEDDLNKNHPIFISRLPLNKLNKAPGDALEYYAKDKTWKQVGDLRDAFVIMDRGATEMTVRLHPELKRWVAVYSKSGAASPEIVMRVSPSLEGPWTEPATIYNIKEGDPDSRGFDPETVCQSAKEHVEIEAKKQLKISYVCSTQNIKKLTENLELNKPKTIRLPLNYQIK